MRKNTRQDDERDAAPGGDAGGGLFRRLFGRRPGPRPGRIEIRVAAARANIAAKKPHDFKVTVDPDGSVIMTLDTGERVRLESA